MESITGFVEHVIYRNAENGYTVFNLVYDEKELTCVGSFHSINEGESLEVTGTYTSHPSYGEQFKVDSFQLKAPEDILSIERYLGSGAIRGIGPSLAARIVKSFKKDTFRIIEEEPERLAEVKGVSEKKARDIAMQVAEKRELRQAMMFLQKYGISQTLSVKIYHQYGNDIYVILKENPYRLADDIQGIGFKIADEIAVRAGIHADSDFRIRSGVLYVLLQAAAGGHTCLPGDILTKRCEELLGLESVYIEKHYMDLAIEKKLMIKRHGNENYIYAAAYYFMEINVAVMLKKLDSSYQAVQAETEHNISEIENSTGMELDFLQAEAVKEAAAHGLLIITGGPGTGKTTTINAIIKYFEMEQMDICLAAPTGRAAKRMSETTGYEARTIHRMLEVNGGPEGAAGFERNENNPLHVDVIIIDEVSMVDIALMNSLLKAVMSGTRLILVGDVNQLPSVGPGNVLKDLIDSDCFHVVRLTKIFRQASQSDIIVNAHKINRGEAVVLDNKSMDFFFLKRYRADVIINIVLQLVKQKLPAYVEATPYDIQVLTPVRKGLLGVEHLNRVLQQFLNPSGDQKKEKEHGGRIFREGDKVMQMKNNYQTAWEVRSKYGLAVEKGLGVFNGDTGIIGTINEFSETVTVEFEEGRIVEYPFAQLDELELSYAITIHKSQGSEYPAVVIPLLKGPRMLMNRNLLYTAVTRARKCVTLVGDDVTFQEMIENMNEQKRFSGLKQRLRETAAPDGEQ